MPTVLSLDNGDIITNSYIANIFNNYFASIAETPKNKYNVALGPGIKINKSNKSKVKNPAK